MQIIGAHSIIYSTDPEKDREFLRDVLKLTNVDVGEGWLIFGLPPSEVAVHPSSENDVHEFYLMCDDIRKFIQEMAKFSIVCSNIQDRGWGLFIKLTLPGGGKLGIYQPRHGRPKSMTIPKPSKIKPQISVKKTLRRKSKGVVKTK